MKCSKCWGLIRGQDRLNTDHMTFQSDAGGVNDIFSNFYMCSNKVRGTIEDGRLGKVFLRR